MSRNLGGAEDIQRKNAFVQKLYAMLEDPKLASMIWWTRSSSHSQPVNDADFNAFTLRPNKDFSECLKQYFKHGNVASLVRQLHMYGFHKVIGDVSSHKDTGLDAVTTTAWTFTHSSGLFRRGDETSLNRIKRRPGLSGGRRNNLKTYVGQSLLEQRANPVLQGLKSPMLSFSNGVGSSLAGTLPRHQLTPHAYLSHSPAPYQQHHPSYYSSMLPYYQTAPASCYAPHERYPMSFSLHTAHQCHCAPQPGFDAMPTVASLPHQFNPQFGNSWHFTTQGLTPLSTMVTQCAVDPIVSAHPAPDRTHDLGRIRAPYPFAPRDAGFMREDPAFLHSPYSLSSRGTYNDHRCLPISSIPSAPSNGSFELAVGDRIRTNKDYAKRSTPPASPCPGIFEDPPAPHLPSLPPVGARKVDLPLNSAYSPITLNHNTHDIIDPPFESGKKSMLDSASRSASSSAPSKYSPKRVTVPSLLA